MALMRQPSRRSEEHTSELQSPDHLVCRLLLEKKKTESSSITSARRGRLPSLPVHSRSAAAVGRPTTHHQMGTLARVGQHTGAALARRRPAASDFVSRVPERRDPHIVPYQLAPYRPVPCRFCELYNKVSHDARITLVPQSVQSSKDVAQQLFFFK